MIRRSAAVLALGLFSVCLGQPAADDAAMQHSVDQLRAAIGRWDVTTDFLNEDGSVAKTVTGTYEFSWVVPDRVVAGRSEIPASKQASGILFYVSEDKRVIEMVSVGGDGNLWTMTGPLGGEERLSQEFNTASGGSGRLRFTRSNIRGDTFESRMEYTEDGGKSWKPGNHQRFRRAANSPDTSVQDLPLPQKWSTHFVMFLIANPDYTPQSPEAEKALTLAHIQYQLRLHRDGRAIVAGGLAESADDPIIGMTILRAATLEEARALAASDPAVDAGRLVARVREWWVPTEQLP